MEYIIKMMGGESFKLNQQEYQSVIANQDKPTFISRLECYINPKSISSAYPEHLEKDIENRREQMTGRLHDGTRVKRYFGQWVIENMAVDDNGKYVSVRIDPAYYPEVVRDCVSTEQEFEKLRELPAPERLQKMLAGTVEKRLSGPTEGPT